jgi:hypothetical protein
MPDPEKISEEDRRIRYLRIVVDLNLNLIANGNFSKKEALQALAAARKCAVKLFPGKGDVFDLVYRPRFLKLIEEVYG